MKYKMSWLDKGQYDWNVTLPDYVYILDKEIDGSVLQDAVNRAVELHPHFRSFLSKDENNEVVFVYEPENTLEYKVVKHEVGDKIRFDDNELDWQISYNGNKLMFSGMHYRCDGTGINNFMWDVIGFYYMLLGEITEEELNLPLEADEYWYADPYLKVVDPDALRPYKKPEYGETIIVNDRRKHDEETVYYRFRFSKEQIYKEATKSEVTPFAVFNYYFVNALIDELGVDSGIIQTDVIVNVRNIFGINTDRNAFVPVRTAYDVKKMMNFSKQSAETVLRTQVDINVDKDMMNDHIAICAGVREYSGEYDAFQQNFIFTFVTKDSLYDCIRGKVIDYYVSPKESQVVADIPIMFANTFKDRISIAIIPTIFGKEYITSLKKVFDRNNIDYEFEVVKPNR